MPIPMRIRFFTYGQFLCGRLPGRTRRGRGQARAWREGSSFPPLAGQAFDHSLPAEVNCDHFMCETRGCEPPLKPDLPPEPHRALLCRRCIGPEGGLRLGRDLDDPPADTGNPEARTGAPRVESLAQTTTHVCRSGDRAG